MWTTGSGNRLSLETSPYLMEHAGNPVAWWAWGEEAFAEAARRDLPIFLSIGYASCHWCHVMAQESFENPRIAELLNARFLPIKVDREQRPDVDAFYMQACLSLQGQGGWPLTVFLMPDRRPFYADTYLPPETTDGRMGLLGLLSRLCGLWEDNRSQLEGWAEQLCGALELGWRAKDAAERPQIEAKQALLLLSGTLEQEVLRIEDRKYGGTGNAPKFPNAPLLFFLLRRIQGREECDAQRMLMRALRAMASGGIHDHVGHGFFRYAVDRAWHTPHYEKMLYDQALLAQAYLRATALDASFARVACDALDYLLESLSGEDGGFFSSQDADDPNGEGAFYRWTPQEILALMGTENGERLCLLLNIGVEGGALDDARTTAHGKKSKKTVCDPKTGCALEGFPAMAGEPHLGGSATRSWLPRYDGARTAEDEAFLLANLPILRSARERRPAPRVIKLCPIIGNGLAIAALAEAAQRLQIPKYLHAAVRAADFVARQMTQNGRLMGSWSGGRAGSPATLEGYAAWIGGLLALHAAQPEADWLRRAVHWQAEQQRLFAQADGAYAMTGTDMRELPITPSATSDDAIPSGIALSAANLQVLHRATGEQRYADDLNRLLHAALPNAHAQPMAHAALLAAME